MSRHNSVYDPIASRAIGSQTDRKTRILTISNKTANWNVRHIRKMMELGVTDHFIVTIQKKPVQTVKRAPRELGNDSVQENNLHPSINHLISIR